MSYSIQELNDIIQWDIGTWGAALPLWDKALEPIASQGKALELGAGRGGLSLYLASKGYRVVCSDLTDSRSEAFALHRKYGLESEVTYQIVDAAEVPFPDNSFDVVIFKSLLGAIGRARDKEGQQRTIEECHRVLKPGGVLLFAENIVATRAHMYLRRKFVKWGRSWRYVSLSEMKEFLTLFSHFEYSTKGFFALLGRSERQKNLLSRLDNLVSPIIPKTKRYMICGYARK